MRGTIGILLLLLVLAAISIAAWLMPLPNSAGRPTNSVSEEKLVIISPHWDGIRNEFGRAFVDWYKRTTSRTIAIEWLDMGGTSDCVRYVRSEFGRSPTGIKVDLFFGGGTDPFLTLKKEHLLQLVQLDSTLLQHIPQTFSGLSVYDADGLWYGAALSGFGIVYNKAAAKYLNFPIPREWKDLADPRLYSWVGAADPRNSGTMHLMFEIILQGYGWDRGWSILTGLAANTKSFAKGANEIPKMVARGDMAFGLCIDFYGWAEVSEAGEDKVGMALPEDLTVISADGIAMLKGAPNAAAAKMFIEFVLSEDGQKLWFLRKGEPGGPVKQELNRMSVRTDFFARFATHTNIKQDPFAKPNALAFNQELASKRWLVVNDLAGTGLIDMNDRLKKAWRSKGSDAVHWDAMPVTEEECSRLAQTVWSDQVQKNRTLLDWQHFFEEKYRVGR